jgi:hypothetical protein
MSATQVVLSVLTGIVAYYLGRVSERSRLYAVLPEIEEMRRLIPRIPVGAEERVALRLR